MLSKATADALRLAGHLPSEGAYTKGLNVGSENIAKRLGVAKLPKPNEIAIGYNPNSNTIQTGSIRYDNAAPMPENAQDSFKFNWLGRSNAYVAAPNVNTAQVRAMTLRHELDEARAYRRLTKDIEHEEAKSAIMALINNNLREPTSTLLSTVRHVVGRTIKPVLPWLMDRRPGSTRLFAAALRGSPVRYGASHLSPNVVREEGRNLMGLSQNTQSLFRGLRNHSNEIPFFGNKELDTANWGYYSPAQALERVANRAGYQP